MKKMIMLKPLAMSSQKTPLSKGFAEKTPLSKGFAGIWESQRVLNLVKFAS